MSLFGPQPAPRLSTSRPPAPAGTGVLSWLSWSRQIVVVTTCVRPIAAAAPTLINSASGQVLDLVVPLYCLLTFCFFIRMSALPSYVMQWNMEYIL